MKNNLNMFAAAVTERKRKEREGERKKERKKRKKRNCLSILVTSGFFRKDFIKRLDSARAGAAAISEVLTERRNRKIEALLVMGGPGRGCWL